MVKQDSALLQECLSGNREAWENLVKRYSRLIYSIALRCGIGEDDAADVLQSVCIKLLSNLEKLNDDKHLRGWMITTAKRECWSLLRQRRRHIVISTSFIGESKTELMESGEPLPMDTVIQLEEDHLMRLAVAELSLRHRRMIELLYFTDPPMTYVEISQQLNIPVGAIGPTRARCLKSLKQKLAQLGF